ncbi:hypothetical protein CWI75_14005 [Kineobactrum sediminis]|uniref:FHA domain-containing protein n=1 Tax=Kineobactrum sediminis TaxID=1905677 RepID=A0A2N5Y0D0_9GAMM|nr:hypothetical protein [Kineobactrum sediminis]PLW81854.1 hypothetical protein CWI75_14005 [Kineobactrum sediminis]
MTIACLDITDSNLQLWHLGKRLQSPGYALLENGGYRFGAAARASARLRPRDVATRYWWQLGTDPLQPALGPARHNADLVHAHLQALHRESGEPAEILLAVPGSMHQEQLALLLGIIEQCPFTAVGLVNRSVALASLYQTDCPVFHLEIQLHQALLTELRAERGEVALQQAIALPGCGLLQLQERIVEAVASAFIRQTRFDPRRRAETEQQLYDALPAILQQLQGHAESTITVNSYQARISRGDLQAASDALYRSVHSSMSAQDSSTLLLLDPITALLPGLQARLGGALLDTQDLQAALSVHEPRIVQREQALIFISRLPQLDQRTIPPADAGSSTPAVAPLAGTAPTQAAGATPASAAPTHLLQDHQAKPLTSGSVVANGWSLVYTGGSWHLQASPGAAPLTRNGNACNDGDTVASGDCLQLDDTLKLQLITVNEA